MPRDGRQGLVRPRGEDARLPVAIMDRNGSQRPHVRGSAVFIDRGVEIVSSGEKTLKSCLALVVLLAFVTAACAEPHEIAVTDTSQIIGTWDGIATILTAAPGPRR